MTLVVILGHRNCLYLINHISLPISDLYSNNHSILPRFRYITIFTVYTRLAVTPESPAFSKRQMKLQATCAFQFTCKHIVDNTRCMYLGIVS